jgi:glycosyltransferase involved in cell wall biosynthesis
MDQLLERRTLRRAAQIVTIHETSTTTLVGRYPNLAGRIVAIPNGFDPDDLVSLPARRPVAPNAAVRFLFAGSLRGTQDVGEFFEAFGACARAQPGAVRLTLLGYISHRHDGLARATIPAEDLEVLPPVSHRSALEATAAADVLVVFTGGGGAGADTLTGKLYEYLALARPVLLVGPPGPAADLVRQFQGVVARQDDNEGLAAAITEAALAAREPRDPPASLNSFIRSHQAVRFAEILALASSGSAHRPKPPQHLTESG